MFKIIFALLILAGCATAAEWARDDVRIELRTWDWCTSDKFPAEYHHKGMCRSFYEKKKSFVPPFFHKQLGYDFCAWGDINCMNQHQLFSKRIVPKQ